MNRLPTVALIFLLGLSADAHAFQGGPPSLESQLLLEKPETLVEAACKNGDVARGALIFFRPELGCAKCHDAVDHPTPLGPDLTRIRAPFEPNAVIEAILAPSKQILKGYEPVTVATKDGKVTSGLFAGEDDSALLIRDAAKDGETIRVLKKNLDERKNGGLSVMPAGLVNLLSTRQDFLDLAAYVLEIRGKGPARALALRPPASRLMPAPLPECEKNLDHSGFIAGMGKESFKRGEAIYNRVCTNCHGTKDNPGSLPTSLRFASGTFKNGGDPFKMYQTLTRGFGMMTAQPWMVPEQKYDVIHYIREAYLKPFNRSQFTVADRSYLNGLPKGSERGPRPSLIETWSAMDYGPSFMGTIEVGEGHSNIAYKGIAVRLDPGPGGVSRGSRFVVYEHDTLRLAGAWSGAGFIDWKGINFNGEHGIHPHAVGKITFEAPPGPAWANPETGKFDDPRIRGRDGLPYGPLPRTRAHYRGTYHHGNRVILSYEVGGTSILESPGLEGSHVSRTLEIGKGTRDLALRLGSGAVSIGGLPVSRIVVEDGFQVLRIPASQSPRLLKIVMAKGDGGTAVESLSPLTRGGPPRRPEILKTRAIIGKDDGPFAVDIVTHPNSNPWLAQMRFTGLDFFESGKRLATCTWDGDVWLVDGIDDLAGELSWRRIASGLFQPLGLKIVDGQIHVLCRDQIAILRDLNGDGETDFYENFNSDHQVTEHFHEFAMDLQTDAEGNFYYAKAARHGLKAVVPQHGTLLKVSKDGNKTEILATGFRAPNGVCVNADGTFFMTDQEGFWHPKNRINLVKKGGFYGNMWGYHDVTDPSDSAMQQPLCWITNAFDRSPGEILRVTSDAWGPLKGSYLNLSYGMGKVFVVPFETVNGQVQGGMSELPGANFPTGVMRGRFHPTNGQLYLCGMYAWAGNKEQPGGFYRLRATGKPMHVPVGLHASKSGMTLKFSDPLDRLAATAASNYAVQTWSLKRTVNYGSKHYDEQTLNVKSAALSEDGRSVSLEIEGMRPTWCMEIAYTVKGSKGEAVTGRIDNTLHVLEP